MRKSYTLFFSIGITVCIVLVYLVSVYLTVLGKRLPEEQKERYASEESGSVRELFDESNVFTKGVQLKDKKTLEETWEIEESMNNTKIGSTTPTTTDILTTPEAEKATNTSSQR